MAFASTPKVVLGTFAFLIFWVLALFPSFPILPIGRTAGSVTGAALMVVFQVVSPDQAYESIDLPILGLLFGTMVVSLYLEKADMFKYLAKALSWKSRGGKDLLCRISFLIAIASAFFTNDTCCILFTEFILKLCRQKNLPPEPFLIALASSANIGSSATPIGNPQNLVIAVQSKISFGKFLQGILPAMAVGLLLNTGFLLLLYWKQLSKNQDVEEGGGDMFGDSKDQFSATPWPLHDPEGLLGFKKSSDAASDGFQSCVSIGLDEKLQASIPQTVQHPEEKNSIHASSSLAEGRGESMRESSSLSRINSDTLAGGRLGNRIAAEDVVGSMRLPHGSQSDREIYSRSSGVVATQLPSRCESPLPFRCDSPALHLEEKESLCQRRKRRIWTTCVYSVAVGFLIALLYGMNLSWCALTAAVALIIVDFSDAGPCLDKVSYSLLVFFSGMFITINGFNRTGIPGAFWTSLEPYTRIDQASGIAMLSFVVMILSNVASNVPTVLLLGPRIAASAAALSGASVTKAWLILAWTSTIAGNLTLIGSAANLIVCEQARKAPLLGYHLSFWRHLRYGIPATIMVVIVGLPLVRG